MNRIFRTFKLVLVSVETRELLDLNYFVNGKYKKQIFNLRHQSNNITRLSILDYYLFLFKACTSKRGVYYNWSTTIWPNIGYYKERLPFDLIRAKPHSKLRSVVNIFEGTTIPNKDCDRCSWQPRSTSWWAHAHQSTEPAIIISYRSHQIIFPNNKFLINM